jgi:UDP-glucose 4-epimerase
MMRVLVTGGAGFIGSHLVDRLINDGCSVRVIDDLSTGKLDNIAEHVESGKVEFVKGDIRDLALLKRCVDEVDGVVHLAAQISVPFSVLNPQLTFGINEAGTLKLLKTCVRAKVRRFVLASTCAVYGEPVYLPVDEKHPVQPISPYAESKLGAERHCFAAFRDCGLETAVLRFFNVYGPRQGVNDYSGVITKFLDRCRRSLPLLVFGDGTQTRDFVNVSDVVSTLMLALQRDAAAGETFNVGTGKAVSIEQLAEIMLELLQLDLPIVHEPARPGDIKHSYADISKAQRILQYEPAVRFDDGLRELIL